MNDSMFIFFCKANEKIIKIFKSETLISKKKKFKDIERDSKPVFSKVAKHHNSKAGLYFIILLHNSIA
jgi:hypothetical protein